MSITTFIRWSGFSLILAGIFLTLGTIIHPSNETPQAIIAMESRLITGHWLLTLYAICMLLGLPGLYISIAAKAGRKGLVGFLLCFSGTVFYAVSSDYGFNAPILAKLAPQTLAAINAYPSIMIMDGLFVLFLLVGFTLLGMVIVQSQNYSQWSGYLIIIGWPAFMIFSALALTIYQPAWYLAIASTIAFSVGLGDTGYSLWMEKLHPQVKLAELPTDSS